MPRKPLPLNLDRAIVPISIQAGLANGHDSFIAGHRRDSLPIGFRGLLAIIGMDPNRRPDVVVLIRQIQTRLTGIDPRPDGSHAHKTRVSGVLQNLIKIFDKLIVGQVSVCIKKRHGFVFELLFRTNIRSAKKM